MILGVGVTCAETWHHDHWRTRVPPAPRPAPLRFPGGAGRRAPRLRARPFVVVSVPAFLSPQTAAPTAPTAPAAAPTAAPTARPARSSAHSSAHRSAHHHCPHHLHFGSAHPHRHRRAQTAAHTPHHSRCRTKLIAASSRPLPAAVDRPSLLRLPHVFPYDLALPHSPRIGQARIRPLAISRCQFRRRPNSRSPVSPSRWSGEAHTTHQRSPRGERQRPVHAGASAQWVACRFRS